MVITDDRIRQYFSSRKQKEKASIRDNSRGKKNTTASAASSTTTTTTTTTTKPAVGGMQSHPITQIPTQPSLNITVNHHLLKMTNPTLSLFFSTFEPISVRISHAVLLDILYIVYRRRILTIKRLARMIYKLITNYQSDILFINPRSLASTLDNLIIPFPLEYAARKDLVKCLSIWPFGTRLGEKLNTSVFISDCIFSSFGPIENVS